MKKFAFLISILLIVNSFVSGCNVSPSSTQKDDGKIQIVTTIYPLEDFAKKIGGEFVSVLSIYPAGADAHTYEPTPKTIIEIAESDLFIYSGTGLEAFADDAADSLVDEKVVFLEAAEGIELLSGHHEEEIHEEENHDEHDHHGDLDPHVWIDPILSIQLAENIKSELVKLMPEQRSTFEQNFSDLKTELENLDQQFKSVISQSPNKKILVSHAAYSYWEKRYGIEQISVSGISPSQEPSQKQLEEIIHVSEEANIQYILYEQNIPTKLANIIKNEIGADVLYLHNISVLTDEDMKNKEDYFSLMKKNMETLEKALQ